MKGQLVFPGESRVALHRIRGDPQYYGSLDLKLGVIVPNAADFLGAAGGVVFGVKIVTQPSGDKLFPLKINERMKKIFAFLTSSPGGTIVEQTKGGLSCSCRFEEKTGDIS